MRCTLDGHTLQTAIPNPVKDICRMLRDNGKECYIVGGATRDLLMGEEPKDWDLTTNARPDEMPEIFKPLHVIPTGEKHGTMTVMKDGEGYEVTTYRVDGPYTDKIRPDYIEFADSLQEDLQRRDLSINAIAYEPLDDRIVTTPNDGIHDLKARIIRAPGDPAARFAEHPIRLIRACRFQSRLGFDLDPATERALEENAELIRTQPDEAIGLELEKLLLQSERPSIGIECLRRAGILKIIWPELDATYGVEQPGQFHKYDVYKHTMEAMDATPKDNVDVRWALAWHDTGKPIVREWVEEKDRYMFIGHEDVSAELAKSGMRRLGFSNKKADKVASLAKHHMIHYSDEWTDKAVRKFVGKVGEENLEDLFLVKAGDIIGSGTDTDAGMAKCDRLRARIDSLRTESGKAEFGEKDLAVNGHDIMEHMGLEPGPQIREIKAYLLDKVLGDPGLNTKRDLYRLMDQIECGGA